MTGTRVIGTRVIGIDPGPTPGIVVLDIVEPGQLVNVDVVQCSAGLLYTVLAALQPVAPGRRYLVAVERFVVRGRANAAQAMTRDQVAAIAGAQPGAIQRSAAMVKPWATDARLEAAGLAEATKGMRHARDAARHALFCAVHDAGLPDPLSKRAAAGSGATRG